MIKNSWKARLKRINFSRWIVQFKIFIEGIKYIKLNEFNEKNIQFVEYRDSGRYEGEIEDGIRHGKGVYIDKVGHRYKGEFKDYKRHGKGV